jgi:aerobic-type carbon monoxide dehydrogenase small subunit (CoxS/CutS family)
MNIKERQQAELLESVARRTVECLMRLYKEEMREMQRVFFSDGIVQIGYNEKTQSIEITRPETKDKSNRTIGGE